MSADDISRLVGELAEAIRGRRLDIASNVDYFKGTEGRMRFASDEFREYFETRFRGFTDNWCAPVAQAPVERMHYLGMRLDGEIRTDTRVARWWGRNDADRGLSEALLMMTVARRAFGLVSPSPVGARITFEHPDSAAVVYDPVTRERRAGLTLWQDDRFEYGQLHLPSHVVPVKREKSGLVGGARVGSPDVSEWEFNLDKAEVNPLGAVALVEFRNQTLLDNDPISDIAGVGAMQDAINLVWAYLLNALDYASLPGRLILGGERLMVPVLDDEGQVVGERPLEMDALIRDRMAHIPASGDRNPTIGEWTPAALDAYTDVIEKAIEHIAARTRTPGHYLLTNAEVPATGYDAAEAGLVSKTNERIAFASPVVREINRLAALAEGEYELAEGLANAEPRWKKPQYRSEQQLMDGLLKMRTAGFPFRWIAEEYGLSPAEVERVVEMKLEERELDADPTLERVARELSM
ncbi:MAG TPA: phage portal protein [Beutenbergiaceae bacterium]|nr:phage portal protein [Beutenbergiaceae bacterium]